mmetsp:Transcript_28242/g.90955  ORF Transcript_28242/g.90955 Transcript_28242/m.90955 type:complete len:264 (-) Transcript_28242:186-977(-)
MAARNSRLPLSSIDTNSGKYEDALSPKVPKAKAAAMATCSWSFCTADARAAAVLAMGGRPRLPMPKAAACRTCHCESHLIACVRAFSHLAVAIAPNTGTIAHLTSHAGSRISAKHAPSESEAPAPKTPIAAATHKRTFSCPSKQAAVMAERWGCAAPRNLQKARAAATRTVHAPSPTNAAARAACAAGAPGKWPMASAAVSRTAQCPSDKPSASASATARSTSPPPPPSQSPRARSAPKDPRVFAATTRTCHSSSLSASTTAS